MEGFAGRAGGWDDEEVVVATGFAVVVWGFSADDMAVDEESAARCQYRA